MLQAEAAAAQCAFEHSRAMLEGQLSQLSSAISSQEALIATLQSNEAEAKNLGALYLVRGIDQVLEWFRQGRVAR
jgi:peptidoglycan hydrolase CwlO-like protein